MAIGELAVYVDGGRDVEWTADVEYSVWVKTP